MYSRGSLMFTQANEVEEARVPSRVVKRFQPLLVGRPSDMPSKPYVVSMESK